MLIESGKTVLVMPQFIGTSLAKKCVNYFSLSKKK